MAVESKRRIPFTIFLGSILLAFFVDVRAINWALIYGGWVQTDGLMNMLYPITVAFVVIAIWGQYIQSGKMYVKPVTIFQTLYLLMFYWLTQSLIGQPYITFLMFGVTTLCAFIIPQVLKVDVPTFLMATMAFPSFAIFRIDQVFVSTVDWDIILPMDTTYAFLVPVVANAVYVACYFKKEKSRINKILTLIFSIINMLFFLRMLMYGSRSPILCVFALLVWLYISNFKESTWHINRKRLSWILMTIFICLIVAIPLLTLVEQTLSSWGIEINALTKLLKLSAEGDLSNGRSGINAVTLAAIVERPFLGWGLDRFDANTGLQYPHNFILQTLYDGGALLFCILFIPIITHLKKLIKHQTRNQFAYVTALFFSSVPGALFSQDLWAIPALWVCFGAIVKPYIYTRIIK